MTLVEQLLAETRDMDDGEFRAWVDSLPASVAEMVERELSARSVDGWRAHPAAMAYHLTGDDWFLRPHVDFLSRKYVDLMTGVEPRQIWNLPARYGKTRIGSRWGPVWNMDRTGGAARSIIVGYIKDISVTSTVFVRDTIARHPEIGATIRPGRSRMDEWYTTTDGGMLAAGMDSKVVSYGVSEDGKLGIDDPMKNWQEAHREAARRRVVNEFTGTLRHRLDSEQAAILIVHHRYHKEDLTGAVVEMAEDGVGEPFHHVVLPAIAGADDPLGREPGEVLDREAFDIDDLRTRHMALGSYVTCTPAETPILMADWTTRPIAEVEPGDIVVGFVAEPGKKLRLVESKVKGAVVQPGFVADYEMESGRVVRATRNHRWFTRAGRDYQVARVGTPLRHLVDVHTPQPTGETLALWNYLAGIIDADGHIKRSSITITQTVGKNQPIIDTVTEVLDRLGIGWSITETQTRDGWETRADITLRRPGWVMWNLLRYTPLAKSYQAIPALFAGSGRTERSKDRVVSIDGESAEDVYALETETGNYVAWGYLSSNSAVEQQNPSEEVGNEILREWFDLADVLPERWDQALTSWDLKLKDREAGDYVVGQAWVRTGPDCWMLDQVRGRFDHATTANAIALLQVRHPEIRRHVVEAAGSYDEVLPNLRKAQPDYEVTDEMAGRLGMTVDERAAVQKLRRRGMAGLVTSAPKGDKATRARTYIAPIAEAGQVHLNAHGSWLPSYLDEMAAFPEGEHDDVVDATSQALKKLQRSSGSISKAKSSKRVAPSQRQASGRVTVGRSRSTA